MFSDKCDFDDGCFETPRIPKNWGNKDPITGYRNISLRLKNGKRKSFKLHRAVYMAKYGKIPKGVHVMHLNHNKDDCRLSNLQLGTPSENNLMKPSFGTCSIPNTKVPVVAINGEYERIFDSISQAAHELHLTGATIGKIIDERPKNKYYKSTYSPTGKKFTFRKHAVRETAGTTSE